MHSRIDFFTFLSLYITHTLLIENYELEKNFICFCTVNVTTLYSTIYRQLLELTAKILQTIY